VQRRERERIMGQQRWSGETPRDARERRALERDLEYNALRGRPLRHRLRNATPLAETYLVSLGGPLPYMQRLRMIEDEVDEHERRLADAWRELADESDGDSARFADRWRKVAGRWSFYAVNELIEKHNRYFPVEARLPMDPRTGDYVRIGGQRYDREPLDAAWVLESFPPSLDEARAAEGPRRPVRRGPSKAD
jgi:hypothetical protein